MTLFLLSAPDLSTHTCLNPEATVDYNPISIDVKQNFFITLKCNPGLIAELFVTLLQPPADREQSLRRAGLCCPLVMNASAI